eukprot:1178214-Prorocentrum_minimum.AAC.4
MKQVDDFGLDCTRARFKARDAGSRVFLTPRGLFFTPRGLFLTPRRLVFTPRGLFFKPRGLFFTPRGLFLTPRGLFCVQYVENTLVSGSGDGTLRVWDLTSGYPTRCAPRGCEPFALLATTTTATDSPRVYRSLLTTVMRPSATRFASEAELSVGATGGCVSTGECLHVLKGHTGDVYCLQELAGRSYLPMSLRTS